MQLVQNIKEGRLKRSFVIIFTVLGAFMSGCSTSAQFIIPDNTYLVVHGKMAKRTEQGVIVKTHPFFWTAFKGIDYQLIRKDSVVREGKMPTGFRIASLFWPPYAILYWPVGFQYSCYDLTKPVPVNCTKEAPPTKDEEAMPWNTAPVSP
jgi:hypothetical protein